MNERQSRLLATIINQFIETAVPIGSHHILESGDFEVSGATIRNEMRALGELGLIEQPHTSAGRIPTAKGYRVFVQEVMKPTSHELQVRKKFDALKEYYLQKKDQERVFEAVTILSQMIPNVAFASVPHKQRVYYLGLANVLRQPEFRADPLMASGVAEVLEHNLAEFLGDAHIDDTIRYYIGEENVLPQIQSCSLMVTRYELRGEQGVLGILGPMRMNYAYNTAVLDMASGLLRSP